MRGSGLQGVVRWKFGDDSATRAADLVRRDFTATRTNELWVADLTYVATWSGFVFVAFVIDSYARKIVSLRVRTGCEPTAVEIELPDGTLARMRG